MPKGVLALENRGAYSVYKEDTNTLKLGLSSKNPSIALFSESKQGGWRLRHGGVQTLAGPSPHVANLHRGMMTFLAEASGLLSEECPVDVIFEMLMSRGM
ncbi:hypothetical protein NDU88_011105 [Pleurodeles waltl]|uniref:Uncharacterized protein n=1 Tax=Pleurodeles waltl TaxID=8319 RepID=A0AAV7PZX6_PLEWA|nr:hypothetical protein NDU88_011105 [Pleurodeles waltl]